MAVRKIISDLLEQFKNGATTNAVCDAIDKQLEELEAVFNGILTLTNIDVAEGKQLDAIGDILCLTRAEAALLCGGTIYFKVLDDEPYRKYLKYRAISNAGDGTYYTLISSLKQIIGEDTDIVYSEDEDYPATILLDVAASDDNKIYLDAIPPIKSAGVQVRYLTSISATIEISHDLNVYQTGIACGTHFCGTWPEER